MPLARPGVEQVLNMTHPFVSDCGKVGLLGKHVGLQCVVGACCLRGNRDLERGCSLCLFGFGVAWCCLTGATLAACVHAASVRARMFIDMSAIYGTHQPSSLWGLALGTLSSLFPWSSRVPSDLILSPFDAIRELQRRRQDPGLRRKVERYLQRDIPTYFQDGPILYLARHIATPNFETLRFKHVMGSLGLRAVVGQDTKDLFVSGNDAKRALCKLSVCLRVSQREGRINEEYKNISVVDFNTTDGMPFASITTLWGERLVGFHARLFAEFMQGHVDNPDDAVWIDRHHRGNLFEHYKDFLALFVTHGVLFEDYVTEDKQEAYFVKKILRPAYQFIEEYFGVKPIIAPLVPQSKTYESNRFWVSYPRRVLEAVNESMHTGNYTRDKLT